MLRPAALFVMCLLILAACASTPGGASSSAGGRRQDCVLRPEDSVFAARGRVFRDCDVDVRPKLLSVGTHPDYRPPNRPSGCVSVDLQFVVNTNGEVETDGARIVRAMDDALAQAYMNILPQLKWQPGVRDSVPVRSIVEYHASLAYAKVITALGTTPSPPARGTVQTKC